MEALSSWVVTAVWPGQGLERRRREKRSEPRAPGLNFQLSNPGPAHWLWASGPPKAAAPGRTCFLNSLGVFPREGLLARGIAAGEGEIMGAKLSGGHKGTAGSAPLRKTPGKGMRPVQKDALLRLRSPFAPLGCLYSQGRNVRSCEFHQNISLCT